MKSVYLPQNLDLQKLITDVPPTFKYQIDDFRFIVGTIVRLRAQYKDFQRIEYVPLNAQILQSKIRGYNNCIKYLLENGVIEVEKHGQYIVGTKSRGYKLGQGYAKHDLIDVEIKKASLLKKVSRKV